MLSKNRISEIKSLQQKKFRRELNCFVAEGSKLVLELVQSDFELVQVLGSSEWLTANNRFITEGIERLTISPAEMERISGLNTPSEALAVFRIPKYPLDLKQLLQTWTIVLDDIRDPGNLGTIIRIADWFGISNIICSPESAEVWNPKVIQATMGSVTRVRVHERVLPDFFRNLQNSAEAAQIDLPICGAFLNGENINTSTFGERGVLVIGNESRGISAEVEALITKRITIPAHAHTPAQAGAAESLNAAVATAIIAAAIRR